MPKQALGEMATVKSTGKRRRTASVTGINGIIKPQKGVKQKQQKPIQLKSKALVNLQEERERLLHELHLNEERQQKLTLKNDAYMGQAADGSESKKGKKGKRGIDGKAAKTGLNLLDAAFSDSWHAILQYVPAQSLIVFSMAAPKCKEIVDNSPAELCLWSGKRFSPLQALANNSGLSGNSNDPKIFTLPFEYGELAGRDAFCYELPPAFDYAYQTKGQIKCNHVLPRGMGAKIEVRFFGQLKDMMEGKIVKALTSCSETPSNDGLCGEDRLLVDAGKAGLILLGSPKQCDLLPRVQAALLLASKCLMCKRESTQLAISPSFQCPSKRVLCPNCLKDCTISVAKLKKAYNIVDDEQLALLEDLPFTQNYHRCYREKLVLKEDVADLYGCSWELFVQGSAARKNQMQQQKKMGNEEARAKMKQANSVAMKKAHSLIVRLANFAGSLSRDEYRISSTGTPLGLLVGTPIFNLCHEIDPKEIKEKLYALEAGSSQALNDFRQELAQEFFALKIKRRADIIFEELWNQIDGPSQLDFICDSYCLISGDQSTCVPRSSHFIDIKSIIKRHYSKDTKDKLGLKIIVTSHLSGHKIGSGSSKAWKHLIDDLERRLLKRLKETNSSCQNGEGHKQCPFCLKNTSAAAAGASS